MNKIGGNCSDILAIKNVFAYKLTMPKMCLFLIMQFKHILFAFINGLKPPRDGTKNAQKGHIKVNFFQYQFRLETTNRDLTCLGLILVAIFALLSFISLPADCYKMCFLQHYHKIVERKQGIWFFIL